MEDGSPALEVSFIINPELGELETAQRVMASAEAQIVAQAKQIEKATGGMVKLGNATFQIEAVGNATSKALRDVTRERNAAERAAQREIATLQRIIDYSGKTSAEIRTMKAEKVAFRAADSGLDEYASEIQRLASEANRLNAVVPSVSRGIGTVGTTGKLASHHMQNLAFQFQDIGVQMFAAAESSAPLKMGLMALLQQGSQISGIMGQAGIGIRGVGSAFLSMSKSVLIAVATNPYLLALGTTIGLFAGAVSMLNRAANDGDPVKKYAEGLGLTAKQMRHLDNLTVTWGDTAKAVFQVAGQAIWKAIGPSVSSVWGTMKDWLAWIASGGKAAINFLIGGFVGAYQTIKTTWSKLPGAMGDAFYTAVNTAVGAINALIRKTVDGVNGFISSANNKLSAVGLHIPTLSAGQLATVKNQYSGQLAAVGKDARAAFDKSFGVDYVGKAGSAIAAQARQNAFDRVRAQAEQKGYLDPKAKSDKHAQQLARENAAIEAQIKNLYALADAYRVSGAAALIAEAREKAESDAIKKRGDIELFVNRQIRLAIAQRVSDAAKSTAGIREQAAAQETVNAMVVAGTVPAEQAAQLVKDQIDDLPLLAALQVAQQRGLATEAMKATKALAEQRAERERLRKAEVDAQFNQAMSTGSDRLAELREELRLVGATDAARQHALATLRATQEAKRMQYDPEQLAKYVAQQVAIADATQQITDATRDLNDALSFTADKWDLIAQNVQNAARGMADAFGSAGQALGDIASIFANYEATQARALQIHKENLKVAGTQAAKDRENAKYQLATSTAQIGMYGDMAAAAKGFFDEKSAGYAALTKAEQVFRAVEFALSLKSMAQDAIETASSVAKSGVRAAKYAVEAVAKAIASLPFPLNLVAGAATAAALVGLGISIANSFGGGGKLAPSNTGTGTVLGDGTAQSDSIKNAINALKEVDTVTNTYARQMASSLHSIESQIGGLASLVVRAGGDIGVPNITEGFKANWIGSLLGNIPLIGGILSSLFGSTTTVMGSGIYGGAQSLGSILNGGFNAKYYSDLQKKSKFLGIVTGTKNYTEYSAADPGLTSQFTLLLKSFNDAIVAAAGPLGAATDQIQSRLNSFVINLGKIDLKGLTGQEIQDKLTAVFGAAADQMAQAAYPIITQFQKVGEGAFETLVRVASTLEQVGSTLDMLGQSAQGMGIAAKLGLADQFDSVSDLTNAAQTYFQDFYTKEEQAAAKTAQLAKVFDSLGFSMPSTLAAFRQLVEAQDLTTAAGQATYATLLKLAPAFADLQSSLEGAKSAADIASERNDLQRQLLQLQGNTAALRALDLAKLDVSNRALQEQIWAIQDAQDAAKAAQDLSDAWKSVGNSIMDEVKRIRGLNTTGDGSFASLLAQFNAATTSARAGDMDAAKSLPTLSQALLNAAKDAATSRQELDRIQAQTAGSLEATYGVIGALSAAAAPVTGEAQVTAAGASQAVNQPSNDNATSDLQGMVTSLNDEISQMRRELNSGIATVASNTGGIKRKLDDVTAATGGDALSTVNAA